VRYESHFFDSYSGLDPKSTIFKLDSCFRRNGKFFDYREIRDFTEDLIDHDDKKRNAINTGEVSYLYDWQTLILGVPQKIPGPGEKGEIRAQILDRHPEGRSPYNDPGSNLSPEEPIKKAIDGKIEAEDEKAEEET